MASRAAAAEATRERILTVAGELFLTGYYDDVTLQAIARAAGVSAPDRHQPLRRQGAAVPRRRASASSSELRARRYAPAAGDVPALIEALVDDYDITGDATILMLAQEGRVESLAPVLAMGREGHRDWVREMLGRPDLVDELVVPTDVYAWKLLRRDRSLSRDETVAAIRRMVESLLTYDPSEERSG